MGAAIALLPYQYPKMAPLPAPRMVEIEGQVVEAPSSGVKTVVVHAIPTGFMLQPDGSLRKWVDRPVDGRPTLTVVTPAPAEAEDNFAPIPAEAKDDFDRDQDALQTDTDDPWLR
jgi:hypothetical protein